MTKDYKSKIYSFEVDEKDLVIDSDEFGCSCKPDLSDMWIGLGVIIIIPIIIYLVLRYLF